MTSSDAVPHQVLRIVDASMNRIGEGLRLLEDVARLLLNDARLTQQLKNLRHDLTRTDVQLRQGLLESRDSAGDVGVDVGVPGEEPQRDLPTTVVANARRVQESLRTLEELAKLPDAASLLDSEKFKRARFEVYALERELFGRLLRQDKLGRLRGLYVIVDTAVLAGRRHADVAAKAISGGASVIQLRDKTAETGELLVIARELATLCREKRALFIMNDRLDVAVASGADGLHVGQKDLPVAEARRLLPMDMLLGCSATSVELAVAAESAGADYVAVGSMYPTPSKETAVVVGTEMLRRVREAVSRPLVAIGGIGIDNAAEVMAAGADSVAVIRAVVAAEDPEEASRRLAEAVQGKAEQSE